MEQLAPPPSSDRRYTEAEYLALEESAAEKHEFRRGRIISMAGGTGRHGLICGNLIRRLGNALDSTPCLVLTSDVRVRVSLTGDYLYPDVSVVCEPPVYHPPNRESTLVNPQGVFEVLSPSTADADMGEKLDDYMRIGSLREYVLVGQDTPWSRTFDREPGGMWRIGQRVEGLDQTLTVTSLGVSIPLAEVYAKVTFPPPHDRRA